MKGSNDQKTNGFGVVLLLCFIFFTGTPIWAQNRVDRPFQVQLNFQGAFLKAFGQALSDPEVDDFDTQDWLLPGIDIGYHLNRTFFVGYSFQPSRMQVLKEPWSLSAGVRDANIAVSYQSGNYHNINLRVSPFKNGLYVSASIVLIGESDYRMTMERMTETLSIGEGNYPTEIVANWNFKNAVSFGTGIGYHHIFNNGISLSLGLLVPFISSPYYEDISFETTDPTVILEPNDEQFATNKLRDETFFYPVQFNLRVGYNFYIK